MSGWRRCRLLPPTVTSDHQIAEAFQARHELIADYYDARRKTGGKGGMSGAAVYQPIPPELLYLKPVEWDGLLGGRTVAAFTTFDAAPSAANTIDLHGRRHEGFAQARTAQGVNLFDKVAEHLKAANGAGRRVIVAGYTEGSASRLQHLLQEHGATTPVPVPDLATVLGLPPGVLGIAVWPLEHGFVLDGCRHRRGGSSAIISRPAKRRSRPSVSLPSVALSEGRPCRPSQHGVGRYESLATAQIQHTRPARCRRPEAATSSSTR